MRLQNGQTFPAFDVPAVGGGTISIPQSLRGSYGVVLIYRGAWCPYCQAQLAGFQRASEKLAEAGIKVVALSVDDEATTVGTIEKFRLSFPVGHSANAERKSHLSPARIPTILRAICRRRISCWRRTARSLTPSIPAGRSADWSPRMSSAWSPISSRRSRRRSPSRSKACCSPLAGTRHGCLPV